MAPSLSGSPPQDKYNLLYIYLLIHGIGFLLPWNVFINAREYFVDYKLNTTSSYHSDFRTNFLSYVAIAAQLPNLLFAGINTFSQSSSSVTNPTTRFLVVTITELFILVFTTIMVFVNTSNVPRVFFGITIVSIILINCCVGIHQTLTFGLAAYFPMRYSNAVIIGSNTCGVFIACVNLLTKGLSQIRGQSEQSIIIATSCYFGVATLYVFVCIVTFFMMRRLEYFRYYLARAEESTDNMVEGYMGIEDKEEKEAHLEKQPTSCCSLATTRIKCSRYWDRYIKTFKECWLQCLTVWMVFTCSLLLFPAVQSNVKPISQDYFIPANWFTDITCYLFFNLFALIGCFAASWVQIPGPRFVWIPVLIRLLFFIPFFLMSNYDVINVKERLVPFWIRNDHAYVFGSIAFSFTSGYFSSLAMMYAPRNSPPERAGLAGLLASFFLILGVCTGCYMSRGLLALM